ncbi:MAG: RNA methyltransferase [Clostridia bacterium]|nr:RNA methyltransferase [Clostridia bacterium]
MNIIEITDIASPELDLYVRLTGRELRRATEVTGGVFIAESPTVVSVALASGCEPISLLTDKRLLSSASVSDIIEKIGDIPIYVAEESVLRSLTGFALTRGVLAAMKRPEPKDAGELLRNAKRVAILEAVADSTNIGSIFRSAAALNMDAVLVTPDCCDPLSRRAARVSMGTVLQVPFATVGEGVDWQDKGFPILKEYGFTTAALALTDNSVSITDERLSEAEKIALILGTEGTGLRQKTIDLCDFTVKIPMSHGVDSLNVACAATVAFYQFGILKR